MMGKRIAIITKKYRALPNRGTTPVNSLLVKEAEVAIGIEVLFMMKV